MSGGSWDYLYCAELTGNLENRTNDLEAMRKRLLEYHNGAGAAEKTNEVIAAIKRMRELAQELEPVWKAIEWRDSGDGGDDDIYAALKDVTPT
jgi:hypothetical protein